MPTADSFPTRQYPDRKLDVQASLLESAPVEAELEPDTLNRFVMGLDQRRPRPMTDAELSLLSDPFAELLRSSRPFPLTGRGMARNRGT